MNVFIAATLFPMVVFSYIPILRKPLLVTYGTLWWIGFIITFGIVNIKDDFYD